MSGTGGDAVRYERTGRCATVTMARPPANALDGGLVQGLAAALDRAQADGVTAAVVRSDVPGYFAAGADLKVISGLDPAGFLTYLTALRGVLGRYATASVVTVAAIDGHALGGGLELAMACTLRVASSRARLGVPEVKLGLLPGAGATQRLPRLVGRGPALDLLLSGRSAGGEEAHRLGLVDRLTEDGEADDVAGAWAGTFADGPALAHAAIVRCADAARDLPLDQGLQVEQDELLGLFSTADAREGVAAFLEKRPPRFGSSRPGGPA